VKQLALLFAIFCGTQAVSQDLLMFISGDTLPCSITEVDDKFVHARSEGDALSIGLEYIMAYRLSGVWIQTSDQNHGTLPDLRQGLLLQNNGRQHLNGPIISPPGSPQGAFPGEIPVNMPYLISGNLFIPTRVFESGAK
jgi:hypothetical protein